jgi:hypothetical protein
LTGNPQTVSGSSNDGEKCERCEKPLIALENWDYKDIKRNRRFCTDCRGKRKARTDLVAVKDPLSRKIERYIDEPRIDELVTKIKAFVIQYRSETLQREMIRRAVINGETNDDAEKRINAEWIELDYDKINLKHCPPDLVMAEVLARNNILTAPQGDTAATWHIAFNRSRYPWFEISTEGLPAARPGIPALMRINYVRRKADKRTAKQRLGIISQKYPNPDKNERRERRIFLCRDKDSLDRVDEEMKARHAGEKDSFEKLAAASQRDITKDITTLDVLLELYKE